MPNGAPSPIFDFLCPDEGSEKRTNPFFCVPRFVLRAPRDRKFRLTPVGLPKLRKDAGPRSPIVLQAPSNLASRAGSSFYLLHRSERSTLNHSNKTQKNKDPGLNGRIYLIYSQNPRWGVWKCIINKLCIPVAHLVNLKKRGPHTYNCADLEIWRGGKGLNLHLEALEAPCSTS